MVCLLIYVFTFYPHNCCISSVVHKYPQSWESESFRNLETFLVRISLYVLTVASLARSEALSALLSSTFFSRQEIFSSLIFIVCWTVSSSRDSSSLYLLTYKQRNQLHDEIHFYTWNHLNLIISPKVGPKYQHTRENYLSSSVCSCWSSFSLFRPIFSSSSLSLSNSTLCCWTLSFSDTKSCTHKDTWHTTMKLYTHLNFHTDQKEQGIL